jgi:hypothetical protein
MTITLELTPAEASALTRKSKERGQPLPEYIQARVKELATEELQPIGAQIVAEWEREGVIGYRTDISDSQVHARKIREKAQTRARE